MCSALLLIGLVLEFRVGLCGGTGQRKLARYQRRRNLTSSTYTFAGNRAVLGEEQGLSFR